MDTSCPPAAGIWCPGSPCLPASSCVAEHPALAQPPFPAAETVSAAARYERYDDSPFNDRCSKVGGVPVCLTAPLCPNRFAWWPITVTLLPMQWKDARDAQLSKGRSAGKVVA